MSIQIIPKESQAKGQFNGGAILENKPIGFPGDGGSIRPYSNLFYWAHAWSDNGSLIGEHPHKGFEIMSFVLKGTIDHYDSKYKAWKKLKAGDAQIIRAGNGITHAERLNAGSHIFQIWVDPNLNQSLSQPASYNDYPSEDFPVIEKNGFTTKVYHGLNAPMTMETQGLEIKEISIRAGTHQLDLIKGSISSLYLIEGELSINGEGMLRDSFAIIKDEQQIEIVAETDVRLFVISSLEQVPYTTYAQMRA